MSADIVPQTKELPQAKEQLLRKKIALGLLRTPTTKTPPGRIKVKGAD